MYVWWGSGCLLKRSPSQVLRVTGSNLDNTTKPPGMCASCMLLNLSLWVKFPNSGAVRSLKRKVPALVSSSPSDQGLKLLGPSQSNLCASSKQEVNRLQTGFRPDSFPGSNLFSTVSGKHLLLILNYYYPSLFNIVDALTPEFESAVNSLKIGEEGYNIIPIETCGSTQACHLRSAERKRILTL
ncbi:hypothetical protein AVEN_186828-1 [Araneus ventricosus]|uniref:Uncharacterized protein n=1 Tax=Araneus ventricosus TaxID=182803 RepID=A0A4Y2P4S2_ARAVE|nr:hypothetical protein AVEN_186828-1 [Araneus ventricosus]